MSSNKDGKGVTGKRVPVDSARWTGVYKLELKRRYRGKNDIVCTITYKDPVTGKKYGRR